MADNAERLIEGIDKAKAGEWETAHGIAQSLEGDRNADWFHAILHKIEGDASNSRYWYAKTDKNYDMFPDAGKELDALRVALNKG